MAGGGTGEIGHSDVVIAGIGALDIRDGKRRVGHVNEVGIVEMPLVTQRCIARRDHAEGDVGKQTGGLVRRLARDCGLAPPRQNRYGQDCTGKGEG